MTDTNNITKYEALEAISRDKQVREMGCEYYIRWACVEGKDYARILNDSFMMSYICRAYNITQYGATKQQNRILNVLKKYSKNPNFEEAFMRIFEEYPNGFPEETPKFVDLLQEYMSEDEDIHEDESFMPWNKGDSYVANQYNADESKWFGGSKQNDNSLVGRIIAGIIVVLLVLFLIGQVSKLDIGFGGIAIIIGIIYLIVRKKKAPKQVKQSRSKNNSYTYSEAARAHEKSSRNNQSKKAAVKRNSKFEFKPTTGGVITLVLMCLWAMSGFANGGSPIVCLIIVMIGLSAVIKKK